MLNRIFEKVNLAWFWSNRHIKRVHQKDEEKKESKKKISKKEHKVLNKQYLHPLLVPCVT